jgi:hypothetical protein
MYEPVVIGTATDPSGSLAFQLPAWDGSLGTLESVSVSSLGTGRYAVTTDAAINTAASATMEVSAVAGGETLTSFSVALEGFCRSVGAGFICSDSNSLSGIRSLSGVDVERVLELLLLTYEWTVGPPSAQVIQTELVQIALVPTYTYEPVPEPGTLLLCAAGLVIATARGRRSP